MKDFFTLFTLIVTVACSNSNFSASTPTKSTAGEDDGPKVAEQSKPGADDDADDSVDDETDADEADDDEEIVIGNETTTEACLLAASGQTRPTAAIHGENCINNNVDPGGADFDDYHITITGDLLVADWQLFSNKKQDISVQYNLGTPGSTTQTVSMQIVDCDGKDTGKFDVSTGSGTTTLKARKGDRFTLVTTVTSGCYGRKDVYNLLTDKDAAFRLQ